MHRAWVALALLTPLLVGCLGPDGSTSPRTGIDPSLPAARLACIHGTCNFQATTTPAERQANELSVAVNPRDANNIIASGKDYEPQHAGDCVWDGIYVTFNGGLTWENANLPGSNWYRLNVDPTYPVHEEFSRFWCATDPVVAFGPDGTAYWTVMPYQCDAATGSKLGRGVAPQGGFNDWLWSCSSMYVLVSNDGGATWPTVREVTFGERLVHDKQWLAVAPDGNTVLLCWRFGGERTTVSQAIEPSREHLGRGGTVCSHSRDKGDTWSELVNVSETFLFRPWIDFGPDGRAWMSANTLDNEIAVLYSDDLETWREPVVVASFEESAPGGEHGRPVLAGSEFRVVPLSSLAVDRTNGPFSGRVYVSWYDHALGNGNIYVAHSDDGLSWSRPVRVHDDGDSPHDQFMQAISVGPDGTLDVTWNDRRLDPANHLYDLFYTYSVDGGQTFAPNTRVSERSSDEQYSHHQNGMVFLGDYIDIDSGDGFAVPVWVDTRNEKADAFIARIGRPGVNR